LYLIKLTLSKGIGWYFSYLILEVYNVFEQPGLAEGVPDHGTGVGTR